MPQQRRSWCDFAVLPTPHTGKRTGAQTVHWQREWQCCLLRCLSRCPIRKPDSTQLVYWQRKSQYGFTVVLQLTSPSENPGRCPAVPQQREPQCYSLRCFSLRPAAKPDSTRFMPPAASGTVQLYYAAFPGYLACFLSAGHRNPSTICNIWHILYRIAVQPGWMLVDIGMEKSRSAILPDRLFWYSV